MNEVEKRANLSPEEWRLIFALREIPIDAVRADVTRAMQEFVEFAIEPCCSQVQADGVPCATATASCDRCRNLGSILDRIRVDLANEGRAIP